jgi:aubergine-like protein
MAKEADVAKSIAQVPELCNLTNLANQMKNNFRVMKDVALPTRVRPNQRKLTKIKFLKNEDDLTGASSRLLIWA